MFRGGGGGATICSTPLSLDVFYQEPRGNHHQATRLRASVYCLYCHVIFNTSLDYPFTHRFFEKLNESLGNPTLPLPTQSHSKPPPLHFFKNPYHLKSLKKNKKKIKKITLNNLYINHLWVKVDMCAKFAIAIIIYIYNAR